MSFAALAYSRRGDIAIIAAAMFGLGLVAGTRVGPELMARLAPALTAPAQFSRSEVRTEPWRTGVPISPRFDPRLTYPAKVVRVIDGDTFVARVRVWPGFDVDTKVRLRGIDAPELHARCSYEYARAQSARAALESILAQGGVAVWRIGLDKYAGRVDALVSTGSTADVSAALLNGGFARSYDGGRRRTWC